MPISPSLDELSASSPSLVPVLEAAARAARTAVPVLVLGEPGTGRSLLARAIHAASRRAAGPLVEVDIGVIPGTLFESELFGHRAGAFTGAESEVAGRVARAEGGTLVLDHLEAMPLPAQPKLLRLLAEKRYAPLGGEDLEADVRFVGIASEDLHQRVERGTFRRDLYYRIEVMTLRLPPLRDRLDDLDELLAFFLDDLRRRFGLGELTLSPAARDWMPDYTWPGNLRELRNVLERAAILGGDGALDPPCPSPAAGRPASLSEVEKMQIERALAYTRGHQGKAAEILGISRKNLWEKRRRYGLP